MHAQVQDRLRYYVTHQSCVRVVQLLMTTPELWSYVWSKGTWLQHMCCALIVHTVVPDFGGQR